MSAPTVHWFGSIAQLLDPGYPRRKKARNQWTLTLKFRGPYETLEAAQPAYGSAGTGPASGYMVQDSDLYKEGTPPTGVLDVVCIKGMPDPQTEAEAPPPRPDVKFVRLDRDLVNNAFFKTLREDSNAEKLIAAVEAAIKASSEKERLAALTIFQGNTKAESLYEKRRKGAEQFMDFYPVATLTTFCSSLPSGLHSGGNKENPSSLIPYPSGYEWVRLGDELSKSVQWWELTEAWIGAREVDTDLYPS